MRALSLSLLETPKQCIRFLIWGLDLDPAKSLRAFKTSVSLEEGSAADLLMEEETRWRSSAASLIE